MGAGGGKSVRSSDGTGEESVAAEATRSGCTPRKLGSGRFSVGGVDNRESSGVWNSTF